MRKINLTFSLLLFCILGTAQPEVQELTLKDAILKRQTTLAPQRFQNLQWVPDSDIVAYFNEDQTKIVTRGSAPNPVPAALLKEINATCELSLKTIPPIQWMDSDRFVFHSGDSYYAFEVKSRKGYRLVQHLKGAANLDFIPKYDRLAYTIDNDLYIAKPGKDKHPVVENKNPNIVSGQAIARFEFGIAKGTFWSPQGNLLAFYEKDETDVADYPLLDISTTPGTLKTTKYPMAGQKSEYGRVGVFNRQTQQLVYLKDPGPKDQYMTNLGWGPEEKYVYVAVVNRDQNHMWLNKYDVASGKLVKTLFEETHEKYVEPENPVWFLPNNSNEFLWMSERDGFMHVYRYNTDGQVLAQVTKGNWVVTSILGLDASGKNVIVEGTDETGLNRYAYVANLDGSSTTQILGEPGVHSFQLNTAGTQLIDSYSSLTEPGVVNVIDLKGNIKYNLLTAENPLKNYKTGTTELLEIKADDGTTLQGRMIKPSNFDPTAKYPVLVYVYGGPHAQMVSNRWLAGAPLWMHYMAEKGYLIFTLDNRGSANRGFGFENIIHRQLGTIEIKDQMAGVEYLHTLPYVDKDRMAVHGWSYGGFMTTSLMLRRAHVFNVGVAGGPVTDWKYYEVMYGERYMDRPEENPQGYQKASVLTHARKLKGDLLLIHGTIDDVVVMQHNLALIQTFVQQGKLVDFFPYPMHPHNVRGKDRVHLMDKVLTYIDEKLHCN